jgi:hypothetical protein
VTDYHYSSFFPVGSRPISLIALYQEPGTRGRISLLRLLICAGACVLFGGREKDGGINGPRMKEERRTRWFYGCRHTFSAQL